ncbi:trimeric LpxA-like protein [Melanomma pulvis-pyrius CBS 109.77]|uniref:Trimeric LpxA-like protein n=1 Tax=Melanomma pulvis-pyrius CBS 109.77 TaxID=1314802 RepID=A0A6A6WUX4_9PLEO|nr:trimeric LpxA-like protein [Melanomma pulvis-pyrius CBS 109.77]
MLHGDPFLPYHPQLVEERERCKGAVFRFNNTSNAAVEIAPDERMRHFRSILAARWIHQYRGPNPPMAGHLGSEVFVDTPFMCDYGYNISIGDRVAIGTQCKFLDSGRITIGRNTEVGANVTIDTRKVPNDFKSMKGSRGAAIAADVHIGENVYIGANVTILAGVKIGTGAIIHPGSVVVRDIPRDVVARGNPAEVRMVHWGED